MFNWKVTWVVKNNFNQMFNFTSFYYKQNTELYACSLYIHIWCLMNIIIVLSFRLYVIILIRKYRRKRNRGVNSTAMLLNVNFINAFNKNRRCSCFACEVFIIKAVKNNKCVTYRFLFLVYLLSVRFPSIFYVCTRSVKIRQTTR